MQPNKKQLARLLAKLFKKSSKGLLPREVYVLSVVAFFVALGYGMIIPAIPLFAKTFHVNNAQIGAIISAFAFARFAMGLPAGKLIDLFGERKVQAVGFSSCLLPCRGPGSKLLPTSYLPGSWWNWFSHVLSFCWIFAYAISR